MQSTYIYGLYVCTSEFSLHQESFNVILYDTYHSTMGVLHFPLPYSL
jgi:hypothetical protein